MYAYHTATVNSQPSHGSHGTRKFDTKKRTALREHNRCWITNGLSCRDRGEKRISHWHSRQESLPFSPPATAAPEARPPWAKPTTGWQPPVLGEARGMLSMFSSCVVECWSCFLIFISFAVIISIFLLMCRLFKGQSYCLQCHRHI